MKTYFQTGAFDSIIKSRLNVKTEKREGSSANHVVYTDESKGLADHTITVEGVTLLIPEINSEGYQTTKLHQVYVSAESILKIVDKIKSMDGKVINTDLHSEDYDDLPF